MIRIGDATLKHGICLAPLAGVSDYAFRAIARRFGAEYTVSEMVSAKALCYEQACRRQLTPNRVRTASLAAVKKEELPMAVQLFGSEPQFLAEAARLLESGDYLGVCGDARPTAIDINMGCPMAKVVDNGEGSALLRDPDRAAAIVKAVANAVSLPVTVKMRVGWDAQHINAVDFARRMEDAGASLICVHGRTRAQMYAPSADWDMIARVKDAVTIPVLGNGDIFSADDALRMLRETGVDGVMIARGAQGNPWIFAETIAALEGRQFTPPTPRERLNLAFEHAKMLVRYKGERVGIAEARKHLAWYTKGLRGSAAVRGRLMTVNTLEEIPPLLRELKA